MASIYSWESFIRIHGGEAGARDVFEKVIDDLLRAESPNKEVHIIKASQGDGGIDVYVHQENGIDIYQCKFFMGTLDSSRWRQIKESFKKAMEHKGADVLRWYICMPREMQKEDIAKWRTYKEEKEIEFPSVKLCCIDGNEIISRMEACDRTKNTTLIDKYFHEEQKKHFSNKDLIIPFTMSKTNGAQGGTYVPRDYLLAKIEESFESERIVFLSGMGGCGKSELARAYGYKHCEEYEEMLWLTCDDGSVPDFMLLLEKADLLSKVEKSDAKAFSDKVLIIIDNCNSDEPSFLDALESWTGKARVLITTRLPFMGSYESIISVESESDDLEAFAYSVFERNYCKKPRWGKAKSLKEEETECVREICHTVLYNTMVVSLIGIRLREYSNLSISDCARKIRSGIMAIEGKIKYAKDQKTRSEDMAEILRFLFADILNSRFSNEQKAVLTLLSLTPANWYKIDYVCALLGEMSNEYTVKTLLEFGWLQGNGDRITIHPLIAEVISDQPIVMTESAFYAALLENYLGMSHEYFRKESFLINKVLKKARETAPEVRVAVMLLLNHVGYKHLFAEIHPEVKVAYFVYVVQDGNRHFMYRDLEMNETCTLIEVCCNEKDEDDVKLLKLYNTGVPYTLDLNVPFRGAWIKEIPEGLCWKDLHLHELIFSAKLSIIGDEAFADCSSLSGELHLPRMMISIGDGAFSGCSGLHGELCLPNNLTTIRSHVFWGCSGFSGELCLPETLRSIGDWAFTDCNGLSGKLHLHDNVMYIGSDAFAGCSGMDGELRLPENLTSIGAFAFFRCSGFSGTLSLPESLTSIGEWAFAGCSSFSGELRIPKSIKKIERDLFSRCVGFSGKLRLPEGLTSIGDRAFYECSGFSELKLPESLVSIGNCAFADCGGFRGSLYLPESLVDIGNNAFSNCYGFSGKITLPTSLRSIGSDIFSGCIGLVFPSNITENTNFNFCSLDETKSISGDIHHIEKWVVSGELRLPKSLIKIDDYAFAGRSELTGELRLPEQLVQIGQWAFSRCSGLSGELRLPKSLTTIEEGAFSGCSGFCGELNLPDSLLCIKDRVFSDCSGLSGQLRLPVNLTFIGDFAFSHCNGFYGKLYLPENITNIGVCAFSDCSGFCGELCLPASLQNIGSDAFSGCSGFCGELRLPENLMNIGNYSFYGCNRIDKIIFLNPHTVIKGIINPYSATIIVGYRHSTAEAYAREYGLVFEELEEGK